MLVVCQYLFIIALIAFRKVKMNQRVTFTCLVLYLIAIRLPWIEGQFPKVCATLDSLKSKECCPIPKGFTAPCGSDGNRGTCQEVMIREWNFTYSHYKPFQVKDDRHDWPNALYNKTCKCQSNFAGYDCSKCEFGYYGNSCTQKKILTRKNFAKLSGQEKDRYMRYINMSRYFVSDYVVTLTHYEEINATVQAGGDPAPLFYCIITRHVTQFIQTTKQMQPLTLHMKARDFLRGIDCTCLLGRDPCRKFPAMTILHFLSGIGPQIR